MSDGFIRLRLGTSTPSTNINGDVPAVAFKDPIDPLSLIVDSVPIPPKLLVIVKPGETP